MCQVLRKYVDRFLIYELRVNLTGVYTQAKVYTSDTGLMFERIGINKNEKKEWCSGTSNLVKSFHDIKNSV